MYSLRGRTKSFLCHVDRGLRDIEDCDVFKSAKKEVVNQRRLAPADINDRCVPVSCRALDQCKRRFQMAPVPADRFRGLLPVDLLPMSFLTHGSGLLLQPSACSKSS